MIYDRFQKEAIEYAKEGYSVIVSAPTGAGKTVIAEAVISNCLQNSQGVIYTAPIKALSNQKFRDFQLLFGDRFGILTGDVSINRNAPCLIMTTEIFRNMLLEEPKALDEKTWVIFDEIHYLDDPERGTVWEESLILLPQHMKILGLSATIPNIEELASWIRSIHHPPLKVVKEEKRPVPLKFLFQYQNQVVEGLEKLKKLSPKTQLLSSGRKHFHAPSSPDSDDTSFLINYIREKEGLPCIYFAFGRKKCEKLAWELYPDNFLQPEEKKEITSLWDSLIRRFDLKGERCAEVIKPLIQKGIAYHHAGMLPTLKEVVERLFTSRLLKVIFTTETFALGINMPARSVVFDELRKTYGRYYRTLRTRDFYQMAGRAGRRGMDECGFVYSRLNLQYMRLEEVERIIKGKMERVTSHFNSSYACILNLYRILGERLYEFYPLSFHYFQSKGRERHMAQRLLRGKVKLLKSLGYIKKGKLTREGNFASKIYGYELPLTEFYKQGLLDELKETQLASLIAALVFEPRKGKKNPPLSKSLRKLKTTTDLLVRKIHQAERRHHIWPLTKGFYFHLTPAIQAWMRGEEFSRLPELCGVDEGGIVRYFRMVIQVLREISSIPVISHRIKSRAENCILNINREVVDAEKELREVKERNGQNFRLSDLSSEKQ